MIRRKTDNGNVPSEFVEATSQKTISGTRRSMRVSRLAAPASMALLVLLVLSITSTAPAQALLIPLGEHWKYNVQWIWDEEERRSVGIITPKIIIENNTSDRVEGYIADSNGTRIAIYDGEQYLMVRYGYDSGQVSKWLMNGKIYDGYIAVNIPEEYSDANVIGLFVGNTRYTVDDGTDYNPQSAVFINSARLDYRLNATNTVTQVADDNSQLIQKPIRSPSEGGSLIDWILYQSGLLLV